MIVTYILVFFASILNACMDITEEESHFDKSVFKKLNPKFYCKSISWQYAKTIFGVHLDFWHLCKYGWWGCMLLAIIVFKMRHEWWVHYISMVVIWWATFELFYGKILKSK